MALVLTNKDPVDVLATAPGALWLNLLLDDVLDFLVCLLRKSSLFRGIVNVQTNSVHLQMHVQTQEAN